MKDQNFLRGLSIKAIAALMTVGFVSMGAQAATVSFDLHDTVVAPGETFTVDIVGIDFSDGLLGWGLDIGFDGAFVSADSVVVDAIWGFADTPGVIGANSIVGTTGTEFSAPAGNIALATITFTAGLSSGATMLSLVENNVNPFTDGGGSPYSPLVLDQTATITIAAVPVPAAVWMFGSALGLLGFMRRRMHKA
jgi:hypothetical protein